MRLVSEKTTSYGKKISFADTDEWGKTQTAISFNTDFNYLVTGLELYTIHYGVIRWNYREGVTYSQRWESHTEKKGIGMNDHFSAHLITDKKTMENIYDNVLKIVWDRLSEDTRLDSIESYLKEAIYNILGENKEFRIDMNFLSKKTQ